MDIRQALLVEHSKAQTMLIAQTIGDNETQFAHLMELFLKDEYRITQRAAWVVNEIAEKHPHLIQPYLEPMLHNLLNNKVHDAVARNSIKILCSLPNLEKQTDEVIGLAVDICFRYLEGSSVAVAIKAYSMIALEILCRREPDLKSELALLIEEQMPHQTPAFTGLGKKILKQLK
jgi:hypothetical protein